MECKVCRGRRFLAEHPEGVTCDECFGTGRFVSTVTYKASAGVWRRAARNAEADHPFLCQLMRNAAFLVPDGTSVGVRVPLIAAAHMRLYWHDAEQMMRAAEQAAA
ncbi:MAG: hypothetical protein K0S99_562 [Thermomicrobiales bacterium]|jgi:hypothetical protein|nr:hypothetical protein [Thermomicrobiales bacterium]